MKQGNKTILMLGLAGFFLWLVWNIGRITGYEHGVIRLALGLVLSLIVIFRWKPWLVVGLDSIWPVYVAGVAGMLFVVVGIIVPIRQIEWLGLIALLYACLRMGLPSAYSRDVLYGTFLMYWIHPLPGHIFNWIQLWMQTCSVNYAEWLLHCFNIRCWADGMILRTGFRSFEVPEACSGMSAVVTVLMSALGVAMLFRFKWYHTVPLLIIGLLQALMLNILRISMMVFLSSNMSFEWGEEFLHDTLGLFLFLSILLIQVEASWWHVSRKRKLCLKKAIEAGEEERPDEASTLPRFWRHVAKWGGLVVMVLLLIGGVVGAVYKHRPEHRSVMIGGIVEDMVRVDLESAERAVDVAISLLPHVPRYLLSHRALILTRRGKFDEALAEFNNLSSLTTIETAFKASTLMSLNQKENAILLLDALPLTAREIPGVAIIRAQYGVMEDNPDVVRENIMIAARSIAFVDRVRAFFPYLAEHGMWRVIADIDKFNVKYKDFSYALIAVQARLRSNRIGSAGDAIRLVLQTWPEDPRFLSSLFSVAIIQPNGEWENLFAKNLIANLATLDADHLADSINYSFRLNRPDLAWLAIMRLRIIDSQHPALTYTVARFGSQWFVFRRHKLGVHSENIYEQIDLKDFYLQSKAIEPFLAFWTHVPFAKDVTQNSHSQTSRKYLDMCMAELERRKADGCITARMKMMYPGVLSMSGRFKEAHTALTEIADSVPGKRSAALFQKALLYDSRGDWQKSYESLKRYFDSSAVPAINPVLLFVNALLNLNMGSCVLDVLKEARRDFQDSIVLDYAEAAVWDTFGFREEALFALARRKAGGIRPKNMIDLLYDTGRVTQARKMSAILNIQPIPDSKLKNKQFFLLSPAELAVARRWPRPLTDKEMADRAKKSCKSADAATSPFVKKLFVLEANWYAKKGKGSVSNPDIWKSAGRDNMECCVALHRLAVFLARQQEYDKATDVVRLALELTPQSLVMRRMLILLTKGEARCVAEAAAIFPEDPEIWLASIVSRTRSEKDRDWALEAIQSAVEKKRFSPGVMVRAGKFLLKKGFVKAAWSAAEDAISRGQGFLPAYVLGLECAAQTEDRKLAQSCAVGGAEHAIDPEPFFKVIVRVMSGSADDDVVRALEYLHKHLPENKEWVQHLAHIYFHKGDARRAIGLLAPVIDQDHGKMRVQSLLLAAEAARQEGNKRKAVNLLKVAYARYPQRVDVLNNLVYNLAQSKTTLVAARKLLPKLLELDHQSAVVWDTAAVVYMKMDQLALAWRYARKALRLVRKNDYAVPEIRVNAAEILYRMGDYDDASRQLKVVFKHSGRSYIVDMRAKALLVKIKEAPKEIFEDG
ncbi:MAG: archaeosortase/exosortase family protein [Kiritimatiellae bacterium]|nr:archaeosortase/exosortase family protein [Kiritimatiellia bacterium]